MNDPAQERSPDRIHADWLQVSIARMQQQSEDARHRLGLASELAVFGLRSLTFINGGAIVALFTLAAPNSPVKLIGGADTNFLVLAFSIYAAGVALSLIATAVGYWSQQVIAVYDMECANHTYSVVSGQSAATPDHPAYANTMLTIAMVCAIFAIVCFIGGSASALYAVLRHHPETTQESPKPA